MRPAILLLLAGLAGCGSPEPAARFTVHCGGDGTLTGVTMDGRRIDRSPDESPDAFVPRLLGKAKGAVEIVGDTDTPYRCIGATIYSLQLAGVRKVGFVSRPQPGNGAEP